MFNRQKLKKWMSETNMSASVIARTFGVTDSAIRNILYGLKQPSLSMTAQFAELMGCTVDDLIVSEE